MRRNLLLGFALGFIATVALGTSWNAGFEADPDDTDLAADIDNFIRQVKLETRNRASVESIYGTGSDDNGLLRQGSARAFLQDAAPTDIAGPGQYNAAGGAFAGTALTTDEIGASTSDLGAGRLWVDLDGTDGTDGTVDDRQLNVWDETANSFLPVTATLVVEQLGQNLIRNGSFEVTDGTGVLSSSTVASGWTNLNTADISYVSINDGTEGDGVAMVTIPNTGNNEGASQTLAGLKESTAYVVRARVRSIVGTCDLQVTGGAATVTDTSAAASGVFETLEVTATTTAGPADLVVRLESNLVAGPDQCDWDHVTAFEQDAEVSAPGIQSIFTQDTTADATITNDWSDVFLTTQVTIPSPGMMVQIDATLSANATAGEAFAGRLERDDCAAGAFSAVTPISGGYTDNNGFYPIVLQYVDTSPVVGGTCIYRVAVRELDVGAGDATVNPILGGEQMGSSLRLLLVPAR